MKFDLNTAQRPTLDLTMMDDEHTVLRVKVPSKSVFKKMQRMSATLDAIEDGDDESVELIYEFLAEALSCNRDRIMVTPDDLVNKYKMDLESVLLVFGAYTEFITEIISAKN